MTRNNGVVVIRIAVLLWIFSPNVIVGQEMRFSAETVKGSQPASASFQIDAMGTLTLGDRSWPGMRWAEVRRVGLPMPPLLTDSFLLLTNGDRLPLKPSSHAELREGRLLVELHPRIKTNTPQCTFFPPNVEALVWHIPEAVDDADAHWHQVIRESHKNDIILLRNGDRIEGSMNRIDATEGCTVGQNTVAWGRIAGLAFRSDRLARLRTKKPHFAIVLSDGTRLTLTTLSCDGKTIRGRLQVGEDVEIDVKYVANIQIRQGGVDYLTDLLPSRYEAKPYFDLTWPLGVGRDADGRSLRLAGHTIDRGLWMHTHSEVTFTLDRRYEFFETEVGIDDRARPLARARFAVLLDKQRHEVFGGKEMAQGQPPEKIRLEVRDVREIQLIAEFGKLGDVQGRAIWANPRLWKRMN